MQPQTNDKTRLEEPSPFLEHDPPTDGPEDLSPFAAGSLRVSSPLGLMWMLLDKRNGRPMYGRA